jgi:hypothetical protein
MKLYLTYKWLLRVFSTVLFVISMLYITTEGLPDPYSLTMSDALSLIGLIIILVGIIFAWVWENIGGVIIILGFLLIFITNLVYHSLLLPTLINLLYLVTGVLFIISSRISRRDAL